MANGYWDVLSCSGTYASGTYYGDFTGTFTGSYIYLVNIEDILVSGTCWEIHTGTAEVDDPVCQIQAYEGQWFIKGNDDNFLVADIELMPVRRNSRYHEYGSGYVDVCDEFPMHYRAPATINGNTELIYESSSTQRLYGTCLYNHYLFTMNWDAGTILRYDLDTGETLSTTPTSWADYAFTVIDNDWVVIDVYNHWYRINIVTGESFLIGSTSYDGRYYPSWAVIKDVLCVQQILQWDYYPPSPAYLKRQVENAMFNIWTGQTLYHAKTQKTNADAGIYQYNHNTIANRDFFSLIDKSSSNGGTWPEVVGPEPSEIWRFRTAQEVYGGGAGPAPGVFTPTVTKANIRGPNGDLEVESIAYNPFNEMVYFIAYDWEAPTANDYYSVIGILSPENMSYSFIYYQFVESSYIPRVGQAIRFYRGDKELYVVIEAEPYYNIYNVRDLSTVLAQTHKYTAVGDWYDNCSNVVDVNKRIWYMGNGTLGFDEVTHLYSLNLDTGIIDNDIDTGIEDSWGNRYYYPTDFDYRQVIPQNDCIIVFKHNTIQYAYQGRPQINDRRTQIYRVT